jgi:hypothetical protein
MVDSPNGDASIIGGGGMPGLTVDLNGLVIDTNESGAGDVDATFGGSGGDLLGGPGLSLSGDTNTGAAAESGSSNGGTAGGGLLGGLGVTLAGDSNGSIANVGGAATASSSSGSGGLLGIDLVANASAEQ